MSKSIQPIVIRPFLEKSMNFAVDAGSFKVDVFSEMVKHLRLILDDSTVQETNKSVIVDVVLKIVPNVFENAKVCM